LEESLDKSNVSEKIKEALSKFEGYFICSSEKVKNLILQEAGRQSFHARSNFILFFSKPENLVFEKIEFLA
ncbi:MAG: hypothetical protein QW140_02135, partial [Candidatus Aenigmatarchaeota archaeon]